MKGGVVNNLYVATDRATSRGGGRTLQMCFLRSPPSRPAASSYPYFQAAPRLLVPAPVLDAAMIHTIDLIAPPLVCANGLRPWVTEHKASHEGRQKRRREGERDFESKCRRDTTEAGSEKARRTGMDAWEMQMLQMLVLQALSKCDQNSAPKAVLPAALACQLCQMPYNELIEFFACERQRAQEQEHVTRQSNLPWSHIWTLTQLSAVCRACVELHHSSEGSVSRDFADALLMHALRPALEEAREGSSISRSTLDRQEAVERKKEEKRAEVTGERDSTDSRTQEIRQTREIVNSLFPYSSLVDLSGRQLVEAICDLGWENCGEAGSAAAQEAVFSHYECTKMKNK